jgi:hypothetical protein
MTIYDKDIAYAIGRRAYESFDVNHSSALDIIPIFGLVHTAFGGRKLIRNGLAEKGLARDEKICVDGKNQTNEDCAWEGFSDTYSKSLLRKIQSLSTIAGIATLGFSLYELLSH